MKGMGFTDQSHRERQEMKKSIRKYNIYINEKAIEKLMTIE